MPSRQPRQIQSRETSRLKARLTIRERQVHNAVTTLKDIVSFESAHCSIFETEVYHLQRLAIACLVELQALEGGRLPRELTDRRAVLLKKIEHNQAYGKLILEDFSNDD